LAVGQVDNVDNLPKLGRVNNPPQDTILPHLAWQLIHFRISSWLAYCVLLHFEFIPEGAAGEARREIYC
jgi:hypothetical protein